MGPSGTSTATPLGLSDTSRIEYKFLILFLSFLQMLDVKLPKSCKRKFETDREGRLSDLGEFPLRFKSSVQLLQNENKTLSSSIGSSRIFHC